MINFRGHNLNEYKKPRLHSYYKCSNCNIVFIRYDTPIRFYASFENISNSKVLDRYDELTCNEIILENLLK